MQWPDPDRNPGDSFTWAHLNLAGGNSRALLASKSGLPVIVVEALTCDETHLFYTPLAHGLLIDLRCANLNPGADPQGVVPDRMYINAPRVRAFTVVTLDVLVVGITANLLMRRLRGD